jgi:hypothetical protein
VQNITLKFNNKTQLLCRIINVLIEITNPKDIINDGKGLFNTIKDYNDVLETEWKNDCGYFIRPNGQIIIGYCRNFSNIKNKQGFS